jgi:hypothetical protein
MSFQDAVNAASIFPNVPIQTPNGTYPLPVVMVAIAGAESSYQNDAKGDYGLGGPTCDGSTSWGLWQIHNVHSQYLTQVTGSSNPCDWENWCFNPNNNAKAALAIINGFPSPLSALQNAWYTDWKTGSYVQYLGKAQQAMNSTTVYQSAGLTAAPVVSSAPPPVNVTKIEEYGIIAIILIFGIIAVKDVVNILR